MVVGAVTYYCTQAGTLTADIISFNAFTDEGHTAPLGSAPANGFYEITDGTVKTFNGAVGVWFDDPVGYA